MPNAYNTLGQIVASGGVAQLGISLASGMTNDAALAQLERNHPGLSPALQQAALDLANRGVAAGDYLTQMINGRLAPDSEFDLSELPELTEDFGAIIHSPRNILGQYVSSRFDRNIADQTFPFEMLPSAPGLFGENPEANYATIIAEVANVMQTGTLLQYLHLGGFESWAEVINKALSWAIQVARKYPDRFESGAEGLGVGIKVVLGFKRGK